VRELWKSEPSEELRETIDRLENVCDLPPPASNSVRRLLSLPHVKHRQLRENQKSNFRNNDIAIHAGCFFVKENLFSEERRETNGRSAPPVLNRYKQGKSCRSQISTTRWTGLPEDDPEHCGHGAQVHDFIFLGCQHDSVQHVRSETSVAGGASQFIRLWKVRCHVFPVEMTTDHYQFPEPLIRQYTYFLQDFTGGGQISVALKDQNSAPQCTSCENSIPRQSIWEYEVPQPPISFIVDLVKIVTATLKFR
jgi:hypothetical protein